MAHSLVAAVLAEPAVPDPPTRLRRDWWLVGIGIAVVIFEGFVNDQQAWRAAAMAVAIIGIVMTLWRRRHPLLATVASFGAIEVLDQSLRIWADAPLEFYSIAFVLLFPYSLFRWASGRHCVIGAVLLVVSLVSEIVADWTGIGDAIGGTIVLAFPAVVGVEVRHFVGIRERRVDEARAQERATLARELHDTVAHHVSAIAVRAQAGRVVGATDPEASLAALSVIEAEASRTLAEMRNIVGALRGHDHVDYAPAPGLAQIAELADTPGTPAVSVDIDGIDGDVSPAVGTALFRIAQEAVTNARRHAVDATRVGVQLAIDAERAHLIVDDDGRNTANGERPNGFGLVGMAERAELLGGSMQAGPSAPRGWRVDASLPIGRHA